MANAPIGRQPSSHQPAIEPDASEIGGAEEKEHLDPKRRGKWQVLRKGRLGAQSGDGNGLATAIAAVPVQTSVTRQLSGRSRSTRKGWTARSGAKVKATKRATMRSETSGAGSSTKR